MTFQSFIEVGDVGSMMFIVVDLHGLGVNVRFKSVE
jgi:hypothetical protein